PSDSIRRRMAAYRLMGSPPPSASAARNMLRASSSMDQPCRAARTLSLPFTASSRLRIVMLATVDSTAPGGGQILERLAAQAIGQPGADPFEPEPLVEAAGRVPVEDIEVDALESLGQALLCQRLHQGAGHAVAALLGHHPDILDEDAARRRPNRVVEGVKREADRLAAAFGNQGGELRVLAEAV